MTLWRKVNPHDIKNALSAQYRQQGWGVSGGAILVGSMYRSGDEGCAMMDRLLSANYWRRVVDHATSTAG